MAKRNNTWTEEKISKYIKNGRGQGDLSNYKPWLTIQDVPSSGRSHRIKGKKTERIHHLLSDLERDYFYLLEWAEDVIDIREQYPLKREITCKIAIEKNIHHPVVSSSQTPIVLTTDFFITARKGAIIKSVARTIKLSSELKKQRVIEKFEIERAYWELQGIDWGIVTEKEIPKIIVTNIAMFHDYYFPHEEYTPQLIQSFVDLIFTTSCITLGHFLREFDTLLSCQKGTGLALLKHLIAIKKIVYDINQPFKLNMKLADLKVDSLLEEGRWA
ncbi:TnsA endonuclease N-terminal domain-containing protein [Bacillus cereus]|uniref:TnsA endonuclease N-terminal domain-containing protein n=1 Tax=Bacillus cereus TaxID=1396 RepID=UPI00398172F4